MSYIVRPVVHEDLIQLIDLARQFTLLNLPGDKRVLEKKIDRSLQAFAGHLPKEESEYLFVLEDTEEERVVGSSLILAKHGTENIPHNYFKIFKRSHYSEDLGIGFIHQVLRFQMDLDGPTEIGGLLVDKQYRRIPEKLGKQISLSRFLYMATHPERFENRVLCELTPPLGEDNRSEFWEALGRRFTGLPYQEADMLSQSNKEFISSLFPQDDIYLCLLDSKARLVLGRVGEQTRPAQHLLESIGFQYLEEVDPFDGGPHYGADVKDILPIQQGRALRVLDNKNSTFKTSSLIATVGDDFRATQTNVDFCEEGVALPTKALRALGIEVGDLIFWSPFDFKKGG